MKRGNMVRKVRLSIKNELSQEVRALRGRFGNLISVSNAEWYSLFKDEIRNSIAIEGIFTNRQELLDVLEHNKRSNKQKTAAILGYFEAASTMYEYAYNQFKENEFILRMADIKQIHTLLMRHEKNLGTYIGPIGDFRKNDIVVAQASFKPINMFHVREAMELMIKWFNECSTKKTYDDVTLAAMTHVWFETIHPFSDGNGRVGRILLSYILNGQGLINVAIKGISKEEREQYYHVLEQADPCFNRMHRLIERNKKFTFEDISEAVDAHAVVPFVEMISELLKEAINHLEGGRLTNLNKEAILPLRDLAKAYDYSQDYLRNLINRGHLKAHKKGKLWHVRIQDLTDYVNKA